MSFGNAKAQLALALQSVGWTIPASASSIVSPALRTSFGRIDSQQFAGQEAKVDASMMPWARLWIPNLNEKRKTSGGDLGSYKEQRFPAHIFIYQSGFNKDWQGLGDYFEAVVDATLAYFRNHSAPQGAGPLTGNHDQIRGWGLSQGARVELPDQIGELVHFRATVSVDVLNDIV